MTGAEQLVAALRAAELTVATAESLTGGLVCAALTEVPGASAVVRGGAVTYATDTKASLLGVDAQLLAKGGPVQAEVARTMARGARRVFGADVGMATTGVAGPDAQGDAPVGRVFIAVSTATGDQVEQLSCSGDRATIRATTLERVLALATRNIPTAPAG
ncbi:CinA family protein [Calidifontibacter terrae]